MLYMRPNICQYTLYGISILRYIMALILMAGGVLKDTDTSQDTVVLS